MRMKMLVAMRMLCRASLRMSVSVRMSCRRMASGPQPLAPIPYPLLFPVLLARHILLAADDHIKLCRGNAATIDARNLQRGSDVQVGDGLLEESKRNSGVEQGAEKHVAA